MPDLTHRRRAVVAALLAGVVLVSIVPAVATAAAPPGLQRFLNALGSVETGGRYNARNPTSGAYGKYQILPSNWAAWARQYLGSASAPQTPANQEVVAHRKAIALYNWLDGWPAVAHWWLTGSGERNSKLWSSFSRTYVNRVMGEMYGASSIGGGTTSHKGSTKSWIDSHDTRLSDSSHQIAYRLAWSTAGQSGYSDRHVRYATRSGASASITFTGKGIAWIGPVGPTRGTARVFIDGKAVRTVDLRRPTFQARSLLFSKAFPTAGQHTLKIVVSSNGRPVAIDELIIGT